MSEETTTEPTTAPEAPKTARKPWMIWAVIGGGALLGLIFGLVLPSSWLFVPQAAATTESHEHAEGEAAEFYACPMFCTRLESPGKCPVCGMDMELFVDTGARLPLDQRQAAAIGLRTEPIQRRRLAREIRTLGDFAPDETRQKVVSAWVDGRIDKLYADFTGVPVEKGWHLFDLYSPSLYAAQKELLVARDAHDRVGNSESQRLLENAREKLRLLGLSDEQVSYFEGLEAPSLTVTIPSPDSGVVTERLATTGMYVKQGQPVLRITDLSRLWLMVQVHERDLGLLALGQPVSVEVNAYPGRDFHGRVGFIDPQLDTRTRTVRVRVEVPNDDGDLRPGMFGTATIFAELGDDGLIARPELKGDYACPMHPLQRSNNPDARCEVCGMGMVKYTHEHGSAPVALWAIPREAVLSTGKRTLVYVQWWVREMPGDPDQPPPLEMLTRPEYQGFEVQLGPLAAEYHVMPDGTRHKLAEYYPLIGGLPTGMQMPGGEVGFRIVSNGQFLIDSQMELTGKPSLLRPEGGKTADPHAGHGD
ncbi:MAG: efflux RND transporter periplasmic adaptor subunit [Planctomycetota bacterium]|nr:efflux RND transporter periplasmic adaptor subunit [Planctomycetota bacterium]